MSRTSFYYDCFDLHSQTPLICFIIRNFYLFHYIPRKISKISFYYFDFLFYLFSIYLFFLVIFSLDESKATIDGSEFFTLEFEGENHQNVGGI